MIRSIEESTQMRLGLLRTFWREKFLAEIGSYNEKRNGNWRGGDAYLVDCICCLIRLCLWLNSRFLPICPIGNSFLHVVLACHLLLGVATKIFRRVLLLEGMSFLRRLTLSSIVGQLCCVDFLGLFRGAQFFLCGRFLNATVSLI